MPGPAPATFASTAAFRAWLTRYHATVPELVVRCFKVGARHRGLTYREALDEALCVGWIDGVRRALDEDSFTVRFTPRRARSVWSTVNIRRFEQLQAEGRVQPIGQAAFDARTEERSGRYSFEAQEPVTLSRARERGFRAHREAWAFFAAQPPGYRRTSVFWVESAKREETRARRFAELLACSARGQRIGPLKRDR
jgi:uncharacterized protein YdeI (YjbR/CyaY-like superfamily)